MNTQHILLAGSSGNLGKRITRELTQRTDIHLRCIIHRGGGIDQQQRELLEYWKSMGIDIVESDIHDQAHVREICQGIDVVISALNGDENIIVDGQSSLLEAARATGCRRFIPSDFSVDFFKFDPNFHPRLEWRRRFAERLHATELAYNHILCGAFMDILQHPQYGLVDMLEHRVRYYGSAETEFDISSMDDTARFVAALASDQNAERGKAGFHGQSITAENMADALHSVFGGEWVLERKGTVEELYEWLQENRLKRYEPEYIGKAYAWTLFSGAGKLREDELRNSRYAHELKPMSYKQFLEQQHDMLLHHAA